MDKIEISSGKSIYEDIMKMVEESKRANPCSDILLHMLGLGNPEVFYDDFYPQPGECVIYNAMAEAFIDEEKTIGYTSGYSGASVRLAKGLTIHTGGRKGEPIRDIVRDSYMGDYLITNKRLVFISTFYSFDIKLDKITAVTDNGYSEIYIQSGRNINCLEVEPEGFNYTLFFTKYVIEAQRKGVNLFIDFDRILNNVSYLDFKEIEPLIENELKELPNNEKNIFNNLNSASMKSAYKFLIKNSLEIGLEHKMNNETTFKEMILEICSFLEKIRELGHIHYYDNERTELLSENEFLTKYKFVNDIDFEEEIMPYIREQLLVIFSIISFLRNTRNCKDVLDKIINDEDEQISDFDKFINEEKNKWVEDKKDIENYLIGSLQYYIKTYGDYCDPSLLKCVVINGKTYKFIPFENKDKIDFKDESSYEELSTEIFNFYDAFVLNDEGQYAIEQYLMLQFKYLYNFVKTHKYIQDKYDILSKKTKVKENVYNYLKDILPKDWIILKDIIVFNKKIDIVIINQYGVFNLYVWDNESGSKLVKEDGKVIDKEKNIIEDFGNVFLESIKNKNNLDLFLNNNYPKEGFIFKKRENIDWKNIVNSIIFIPNNDVNVENESNHIIVNPKNIKNYFNKKTRLVLNNKQIKNVEKVLESNISVCKMSETPVQFVEGYNEDYLSKLNGASFMFFSSYTDNLGNENYKFMNLGHDLAFYPIFKIKDGPLNYEFLKTKECEYFIKKFFSDINFEDNNNEREDYLRFLADTLNLGKDLLNL